MSTRKPSMPDNKQQTGVDEVSQILADCIEYDEQGNVYPNLTKAKAAIQHLLDERELRSRHDELQAVSLVPMNGRAKHIADRLLDIRVALKIYSDSHTYPHMIAKRWPDTFADEIMQLIAEETRKARLGERKAVALDNYQGHTFSDSTNWEGKFQKFIDNNERRISQLTKPGEDTFNLDEIALCKGCKTMKHLNAEGYCGRCVKGEDTVRG